jgi:hypothetical protein
MKSHSAILIAAALLASLQVFAQTATTSSFGPATPGSGCPTCLTEVPPYTSVLNASNGAVFFPLPSSLRDFVSTADLGNFLVQNFNAELIYDTTGTHLVGARGQIIKYGRSYYLDQNNVVQEITHPINAYVGGISGQFTIGGTLYYSGAQQQTFLSSSTSVAGPDVSQCNQYGECISGHSWNTHWILSLHNSVGVKVQQDTGGYQESHYFCWNWIFPWICVSRSGSNTLTLQGSLFYDPYKVYGSGPSYTAFAGPISRSASNVTEIEVGEWDWFFQIGGGDGFPPPPGYPPSQYGSPVTDASVLVGACARSSSSTINSYGATADGSTLAQNCFGASITCLNGTSLCGGNLCTNLGTDIRNCGACGNACEAGWSCQNAACVAPPPPPSGCRTGYKDCGDGVCIPLRNYCP